MKLFRGLLYAAQEHNFLRFADRLTQHENGDLRKIKVCVNLRKVGHPTLRKLSTVRKGL